MQHNITNTLYHSIVYIVITIMNMILMMTIIIMNNTLYNDNAKSNTIDNNNSASLRPISVLRFWISEGLTQAESQI